MSTTKTFTNIKSGKKHQIDATARGYYDFRTTVVPQPNKPLSYDMKVYDGLNYVVDLSKNSVRPGEINFNGTVLPYVENNTLVKTNYCFGNSGTNYDLPIYNKEYVNINKIGDFDIGDGVVSNFQRGHYLTAVLPNYSSGSVDNFEICMKVHTPTNNTSNARILNSTDSYDNLALDLGTNPGFNFCGDTIGFGSQFTADIDLYVKVKFDGTTLSLHHSLNGVDYTQDNSKPWTKSNVWFTSNTYSIGLRSYDFVSICMWNGSIDLNECYVKINDEIINFGENSLNLKYNDYSLVGNAKINNGICSDFDSSSRVLLNSINFTSEKDIIIGFTTSSDVTTAQKIFEYQNDGISFQIIDGMIQYWTKNNTLWNDYDVVEANNSYKLRITITGDTSYTLGFMNVNDSDYNNIEVTDAGLTVGKNLSFSIGNNLGNLTKPFLGTIDIKNIPGAIQTESKTGIFQDYEDNGKAKTLNCHSYNNEYVILSPNDTIENYTYLGKVNIQKHKIEWNDTPDEPTTEGDTAIAFNNEVAGQDLGSDIYVNSGQGINEYYYTAYPVNDSYKSNSTILATISKKSEDASGNTLIDFDRKEQSKEISLDVSTNEDDAEIILNNYEPTTVEFNINQDNVEFSSKSYNDGELPSSKYSLLNFKFNVDVTDDEVEIVVDGIKYKLGDLPVIANIESGYGVKVNKTGYKPYQTIGRKWYSNVININLKTEE